MRQTSSTQNRYVSSRGTIFVTDLEPCINGDPSYVSKSLILAANIDGTGVNGAYDLVQAGIGRIDNKPGYYQCSGTQTVQDNTLNFVFTPSDDSSGVFCRADFYDFDSNGTIDNPIIGHRYMFTIIAITQQTNPFWQVCIQDVSANTARKCKNVDRDATGGVNRVWWGFEVGNLANQLGSRDVDSPRPYIDQPSYYTAANPTTWVYTTASTVSWDGGKPAFYEAPVSQRTLGEQLYGYTEFHE